VRLFFPCTGTDGKAAELWVKSDVLSKASPYFTSLLDSEFSESIPRRARRACQSSVAEAAAPPAQEAVARDFVDSDDETDDFHFSKHPPLADRSSDADELFYRQITVTQTAFSTYRSLLLYLHSGFFQLAPLSSSFASRSDTRLDFLSSAHNADPSLPLPVSPRSLYRLAHLLDLDDLQQRSLEAIRCSLTVDNAAIELFSDASIAYDELRAAILAFVKENWVQVRATVSWKELLAKVKLDEIPGGAAVVVEVFQAVADA
jgi:hypothetical protein